MNAYYFSKKLVDGQVVHHQVQKLLVSYKSTVSVIQCHHILFITHTIQIRYGIFKAHKKYLIDFHCLTYYFYTEGIFSLIYITSSINAPVIMSEVFIQHCRPVIQDEIHQNGLERSCPFSIASDCVCKNSYRP